MPLHQGLPDPLICQTAGCGHTRDQHPASLVDGKVHDPCTVCTCAAFTTISCVVTKPPG